MTDYRAGDVLVQTRLGHRRYIRIKRNGPDPQHPDYVYVQDSDAAGFLLNGRGRYLQTTTLTNRWTLHYRAQEQNA